MKKTTAERALELIPEAMQQASGWFKQYIEENSKELLESATGTTGLLIKIIGKPFLEHYLAKQTKGRLSDFGANTYLKAAYSQASSSIESIEAKIKSQKSPEEIIEAFAKIETKQFDNVTKETILLIFQPTYHPIIQAVRSGYIEMLEFMEMDDAVISAFKRDFNGHIADTIAHEFGDDYDLHKKEIQDFIYENTESELLIKTIKGGRIGFSASEDLSYEETFGHWKPISQLGKGEHTEQGAHTQPVTNLIEEYFGANEDNLKKILFLIADFGKGKSVFMRHYASLLANEYLKDREGYFPVYFNLREYKKYASGDNRLGVIDNFLQSEYQINISDEKHINKRYVFLMDSLDESGELTKEAIHKVIASIKQIQNINKTLYRNNRIIIASRPLTEEFDCEIRDHEPCTKNNEENRPVDYFISLYGFKKGQFNRWLLRALKKAPQLPVETECSGFIAEILHNIKKGASIDIYKTLLKSNTLQEDELRRPIFAYIIYQLIINKIDFAKMGKIGVYLSFLNLLTKDAKHINDPSYQVKLEEEFQFRNILHATSALWMYKRHRGGQGSLSKADLCRVIEGKSESESDCVILERNKNNQVMNIKFLSHSYFGEDNNTLHFQHQSFAEILLAEYYLKLFLKYALEEEEEIGKARARLHLGEPTEQTINFFIELLRLLKEAAEEYEPGKEMILEKRKLLFPLLASLSNKKCNTLFSTHLYYSWYSRYVKIEENQVEYPKEALINWGIKKEEVDKIVSFAAKVLNSKYDYIISEIEREVNLFSKDVVVLHSPEIETISNTIDKWLSLIVGDVLYTDVSNQDNLKLFNTDYKINSDTLLRLLSIRNGYREFQLWKQLLFRGIDTRNYTAYILIDFDLLGIDLSYSFLQNIVFRRMEMYGVDLSYTVFDDVLFSNVDFANITVGNTISKSMDINNIRIDRTYVNISTMPFLEYTEMDAFIHVSEYNLYGFFYKFASFFEVFIEPTCASIDDKINYHIDFSNKDLIPYFWEIYNNSIYEDKTLYKEKIKQILKEVYKKNDEEIEELIPDN